MELSNLEMFKRLLLALLLSGLIGYEREYTNKPAGFRTHILVCTGATIVMMISIRMYELYQLSPRLDPTRLGAQVISGIGFLGVGTIIREGDSVKGLTTAASIWTIGCIGLSIGAGLYILSLLSTFFVFLALVVFNKAELLYISKKRFQHVVVITVNESGQLQKISDKINSLNIKVNNIEMITSEKDNIKFDFLLKLPSSVSGEEFVQEISALEEVLSVKLLY
ncbi:MgtC/SapB family protein [Irregularibacter muris]|uniref:MgtC/SapB family protein n=1 Tax=Irregularibacter muris TaxID=1796619 RepID=A0AAE3KZ49_9FIRM|nr:MgtC/SapB family protein [Irregularibacter muris]MCR1898111.1 MgtC/SapB family protein [Irregularibacter muris]